VKKTIGIIGGMGPLATVELFRRIVQSTPAKEDQDHLRIIIDNNPEIPDRTAAILGEGESPLPLLTKTASILEQAGADILVMPCNTAHFYIDELLRTVRIPIINMIEEVVKLLRTGKVGLLATDGTRRSGVYHRACAARGRTVIEPNTADQNLIMRIIYEIKAGVPPITFQNDLLEILKRVQHAGAEEAIIGCTELSLIPLTDPTPVPIHDALTILAQTTVEWAYARG